ncbi:MAG: hypothetical protein PT941_00010, partial [Bacillales bacterium]|nr:hypothetical protein [Bacillales bacterium]
MKKHTIKSSLPLLVLFIVVFAMFIFSVSTYFKDNSKVELTSYPAVNIIIIIIFIALPVLLIVLLSLFNKEESITDTKETLSLDDSIKADKKVEILDKGFYESAKEYASFSKESTESKKTYLQIKTKQKNIKENSQVEISNITSIDSSLNSNIETKKLPEFEEDNQDEKLKEGASRF